MAHDLCQLFSVLDLANEAQAAVNRALEPFGLTEASLQVMWHLRQGTCTNKGLAEDAGCAPSNITRLVDRLVAQGLVERRPSETDRRQIVTSLTDAGRDLWESASRALQDTQATLLHRLRDTVDAD